MENIWKEEIGEFVLSLIRNNFSEEYTENQFKDDFDLFVQENNKQIRSKLTEFDNMIYPNTTFKHIVINLSISNSKQIKYLCYELDFQKTRMPNSGTTSSESSMVGMYDTTPVDKSVLMFLK